MTKTAANLIAESTSHNTVAHADYDSDLADELYSLQDDGVENFDGETTVHEFWGTDNDGAEWRVHLTER